MKIKRLLTLILLISIHNNQFALQSNPNNLNEQFLDACYHSKLNDIRECIKKGADVNYAKRQWHSSYYNAITHAAQFGQKKAFEILLTCENADINFDCEPTNSDFDRPLTPLTLASIFGYIDIIKLILDDKRFQPNYKNQLEWAFIECWRKNAIEIASLLLKKGVNVNACPNKSMTLLIHAAISNDLSLLHFLLNQKSINVNFERNDNLNALYFAILNKNFIAADILKKSGAKLNDKQTELLKSRIQ